MPCAVSSKTTTTRTKVPMIPTMSRWKLKYFNYVESRTGFVRAISNPPIYFWVCLLANHCYFHLAVNLLRSDSNSMDRDFRKDEVLEALRLVCGTDDIVTHEGKVVPRKAAIASKSEQMSGWSDVCYSLFCSMASLLTVLTGCEPMLYVGRRYFCGDT